MNETLQLQLSHRTIRAFTPTPVPREKILRAVASAQMAATSSNVQAYSVLQIEDPAERARLAELCGNQSQVAEAGAFLVLCADQRRFRLIAADHGVPYEANLETFLIGVIDTSLFAQNLALAFESMGYGTCYLGGLRNGLPEIAELLELPDDVFPLYGLCVGESAEDPLPRPRLAPESVLFQGRYPDDAMLREQIAEYDGRLAEYYERRGQPGHDWTGGISRSFRQRKREHLFGFYTGKGARIE